MTLLLCFCHYLARSEVCKGCQSHVTLDINLPIASVDLRFFCLTNIFRVFTLLTLLAYILSRFYETVGVRPFVCPAIQPQQRRAAGLLLSAVRAKDIDRQRRAPGSNGAAAVPC